LRYIRILAFPKFGLLFDHLFLATGT